MANNVSLKMRTEEEGFKSFHTTVKAMKHLIDRFKIFKQYIQIKIKNQNASQVSLS
jgi:hypothetical protein